MRKKIIAGNWKMNFTANEAEAFAESIIDSINTDEVEVVLCPNFTALDRLSNLLDGKNVKLGAQNVYFETKGTFTGEISPDMLYALNVEYCIVGHSERRQLLNETDEMVNKKAKKLLEKGITPIICVGETLEEREAGKLYDIVSNQVKKGLYGISLEDASKVVIAYEPLWSISTGTITDQSIIATPEQAQHMCKYVRDVVKELYNENVSENIRVLHGGSVNPKNANEILNMPDIDGALVGGASIKNDFVAVVNY